MKRKVCAACPFDKGFKIMGKDWKEHRGQAGDEWGELGKNIRNILYFIITYLFYISIKDTLF